MAQVKDLVIKQQSNSDLFYASWEFGGTTTETSTGVVKVGSLVSIKSGATYYNGASIPTWVKNDKWYVIQVKGDRAVLGKNVSGTNNINSPIKVSNLTVSGSTTSSTVSTSTLDHYEVKWFYDTGNGVWFAEGESTTKETTATYNAPDNAIAIKVSVKPVSKTYTSNNKEVSYWTGTAVTAKFSISASTPEAPPIPSVEIDDFTLSATIDNITNPQTDKIEFQIYNGDDLYKSGKVTVSACMAVFTCTIAAGGSYRVRCRAININSASEITSSWSDFSTATDTIPTAVKNVKCVADSETSVKVSWTAVSTAKSYEVQYAVKKSYFDTSSEVQSATVDTNTAYITGLEAREWFFRVRAKNDRGDSEWSSIVSTIIGTKPEPPTTWSMTTTAIVGEDITLYWVHNSEDGSKMTKSQIKITINGTSETYTIDGTVDQEEDEEPIYTYTFNPSDYTSGAVILWSVRTKGVAADYSDWSVQRTIKLYAPPTLAITTNTDAGFLKSLPLELILKAGPGTQTPISYAINVISESSYETVDITGSDVMINAGSSIFSKIYNADNSSTQTITISAGDIILKNGQAYTIKAVVSMDSGLTAEAEYEFTVNWTEHEYHLEASIAIDHETLSAYITPYCMDVVGAFPKNLTMTVYRREYNGSFTELVSGISNTGVTTITDPHPALDYARYRVVAILNSTSEVIFEDLPGYPVGEPSIVLQWDEKWTDFDYPIDGDPETPPWTGSMVRLPYNISIDESYNPDVSLIEYIGRKNPVSYYGTQRGETASWSTEIPKSDKETIYALRRLAAWAGDVYVREPSGVGYWAQVTVSMSTAYLETVIPVTFEIARVEGGA